MLVEFEKYLKNIYVSLEIDSLTLLELMLAHIPEGVSGSEGAYNRAAFLERRREIATLWASMLFDCLPAPHKLLGYSLR